MKRRRGGRHSGGRRRRWCRDSRRSSRDSDGDDESSSQSDVEGEAAAAELLCNDGNCIWLTGEITTAKVTRLQLTLRRVAGRVRRFAEPSAAAATLVVFVQSHGGDVLAGLAMYDVLRQSGVPVTTVALGEVASAATIVFLAGARRLIAPNAEFLIHEIRWEFGAEAIPNTRLQDDVRNSSALMARIRALYERHSAMTADEVLEHLQNEKTMQAEDVLKHQLADAFWGRD